jgi:hypothetical protein
MKLPNLFLCCVILVLGTIALRNLTVAEDEPVELELVTTTDLSDSDLDKIHGIVDEKIDTVREEMLTIESELSKKIDDLQSKMCDCNELAKAKPEAVEELPAKVESKPMVVQPVVQPVVSQPVVVQPVVRSVVSQPIVSQPIVRSSSHWSYPGDITTHLQTAHGQTVYGMSIEQQLNLHDALHESKPMVSRTVTRQTSNCPGGVCPTNYNSTSRTYTRPRLFGR